MKIAVTLVSLSLLTFTLTACGSKGSSSDTPVKATPNVEVKPGTTIPPVEVPNTTPPSTGNQSAHAPANGLYLGACEVEGVHSFASGVNISATAVHPITLIFNTATCAPDALNSWGNTDEFGNYAEYVADITTTSVAAGDEVATTFDATAVHLISKAGIKTDLKKLALALPEEKRLKIYIKTLEALASNVKGTASVAKGLLTDGAFNIGFYCKGTNKKYLRQESAFTFDAVTGLVNFEAKLNTWVGNEVPAVTQCAVTLTSIQMASGTAKLQDVAWSQAVDVK